jgi:hypothetical protein
MAEPAKVQEHGAKEAKEEKPKELSKTLPKMKLEKDPNYGNWIYSRDAWIDGPAIEPNGVLPLDTEKQEDAEAYVNRMYPGSFPEPVAQPAAAPPKEGHFGGQTHHKT